MRAISMDGAGLGLFQESLLLAGSISWRAWRADPRWYGHGGVLAAQPTSGDRGNDYHALARLVEEGYARTRRIHARHLQWCLTPEGLALQQKLSPLAGTNQFYMAHLTRRFDLLEAMALHDSEGVILWPQQTEQEMIQEVLNVIDS